MLPLLCCDVFLAGLLFLSHDRFDWSCVLILVGTQGTFIYFYNIEYWVLHSTQLKSPPIIEPGGFFVIKYLLFTESYPFVGVDWNVYAYWV